MVVDKDKKLLLVGLLTAIFGLGMGNVGDDSVIEIPEVARNFSVILTDISGMQINLTNLTCNGKTFFFGKLSKADASVDFADIGSVSFEKENNDYVKAVLKFKNGDTASLVMDKTHVCFGSSPIADIRIVISDIRQIEFHGRVDDGS